MVDTSITSTVTKTRGLPREREEVNVVEPTTYSHECLPNSAHAIEDSTKSDDSSTDRYGLSLSYMPA